VPAAQSHTIALPARSRSSEWPGDRYLLAGALLLGTIVLVFRSIGLQPVVLADEYLYSKFARLVPFAAAAIPSYLYLALYRLTSVCGDGFLDCARVLNVALFIAAVPFVFSVARTIVSRQAATVIALATLAGPANSYTAYFMPDAAYWLAFWVFAWYLLRLRDADGLERWCVAGVLHGVAALVKPHALLFLPAVVVYIVVAGWPSDRSLIDRPLKCALVLVAASLATKLAVGYVLAGASGLTLFGTLYGGIALCAPRRACGAGRRSACACRRRAVCRSGRCRRGVARRLGPLAAGARRRVARRAARRARRRQPDRDHGDIQRGDREHGATAPALL
jgi:hypothetical protein